MSLDEPKKFVIEEEIFKKVFLDLAFGDITTKEAQRKLNENFTSLENILKEYVHKDKLPTAEEIEKLKKLRTVTFLHGWSHMSITEFDDFIKKLEELQVVK